MFDHFIADTREATCFVIRKLANSRNNFFLSKVRQSAWVPVGIDICFRTIFWLPVRLKDILINITVGSPIIKVLLDMRLNSCRVGDNIIIEFNIIKFNWIFMPVKDAVDHWSGLGLKFGTTFIDGFINVLSNFFDIFNISSMINTLSFFIGYR